MKTGETFDLACLKLLRKIMSDELEVVYNKNNSGSSL